MSGQPVVFHVSRVHPRATEEELAAIISAMPSLWPVPQPHRRMIDDRAWRFSGRKHQYQADYNLNSDYVIR